MQDRGPCSNHPMASMGHVGWWEWMIQRLGARKCRFANLNQGTSGQSYETFLQGVGQIFDGLCHLFEHGDITLRSILKL